LRVGWLSHSLVSSIAAACQQEVASAPTLMVATSS
jgi:hypothetical protein